MAVKLIMPKLGATMEEGIIDNWLVEVGDQVEEGDPVVEVQTDKITIEVEAEEDGILLKKLYEAGETVPVQQAIAFIGEEGEEVDKLETKAVGKKMTNAKTDPDKTSEANVATPAASDFNKIRRTPIARRLAVENNVDLSDIEGTGPLGRIQKADVENYLARNKQKITPLAHKIALENGVETVNMTGSGVHGKLVKDDIIAVIPSKEELGNDEKRALFKGMRKVIANRISDSFYSAPHVTLFSEIDMTECVTLRNQLLPIIKETEGVRISYNDILVKATAFSLKRNPNINISLKQEKEIVYHSKIHIGVAVAIKDGLVVPVLRNVDQKGLGTIAKEVKQIAEQARNGELAPEDMQGSTFTISNLGMYAVDGFTPIINQPNAAILGVGRIQEKPVIVDGEVQVRSMMELSLSFDHRIVDGAPAAQFLTDLKDVLEQPYKLMV